MHLRAYVLDEFELLPYLEPQWRIEIAHAVLHLWPLLRVARAVTARWSLLTDCESDIGPDHTPAAA
jgi:hypothetical protein